MALSWAGLGSSWPHDDDNDDDAYDENDDESNENDADDLDEEIYFMPLRKSQERVARAPRGLHEGLRQVQVTPMQCLLLEYCIVSTTVSTTLATGRKKGAGWDSWVLLVFQSSSFLLLPLLPLLLLLYCCHHLCGTYKSPLQPFSRSFERPLQAVRKFFGSPGSPVKDSRGPVKSFKKFFKNPLKDLPLCGASWLPNRA